MNSSTGYNTVSLNVMITSLIDSTSPSSGVTYSIVIAVGATAAATVKMYSMSSFALSLIVNTPAGITTAYIPSSAIGSLKDTTISPKSETETVAGSFVT